MILDRVVWYKHRPGSSSRYAGVSIVQRHDVFDAHYSSSTSVTESRQLNISLRVPTRGLTAR